MASQDHISDSEGSETSEASLVLIPDGKDGGGNTPSQVTSPLSHRFREPSVQSHTPLRPDKIERGGIAVIVPTLSNPGEYIPYLGTTTVDAVLGETKDPSGETWYQIVYEDGKKEDVSVYLVPDTFLALYLAIKTCIALHSLEIILVLPLAIWWLDIPISSNSQPHPAKWASLNIG